MKTNHLFTSILYLAYLSFLFTSCKKDFQEPLAPQKPIQNEEVPDEALTYTIEDYKALFNKNTNGRIFKGKSFILSFEELSNLYNQTNQYVPNWENITEEELQKIEKENKISRKELMENAGKIKSKYIAKKRFKLYKAISSYVKNNPTPSNKRTAYYYGINDEEFWVLFWNPFCIDGTKKAVEQAYAYEIELFGSNSWLTKGDAFRHSIWNVLIAKYNKHEFDYKSEAAAFAKKFTDAHERGGGSPENPLDNPMDYHNNAQGRSYFLAVAKNRGKLNWWGYDSRWIEVPSDDVIKAAIYTKAISAAKITLTAELPYLATDHVYVSD